MSLWKRGHHKLVAGLESDEPDQRNGLVFNEYRLSNRSELRGNYSISHCPKIKNY